MFRMVLSGDIPLDEKQIQKLQPHKHAIRKIASSTDRKKYETVKIKIGNLVQTGGSMIGSALKVVVPIAQILFS